MLKKCNSSQMWELADSIYRHRACHKETHNGRYDYHNRQSRIEENSPDEYSNRPIHVVYEKL